jgi:hypothetical protein
MNAQNNKAHLSDNELDAVSGGDGGARVEVTREEWEKIVAQKIREGKPLSTSR